MNPYVYLEFHSTSTHRFVVRASDLVGYLDHHVERSTKERGLEALPGRTKRYFGPCYGFLDTYEPKTAHEWLAFALLSQQLAARDAMQEKQQVVGVRKNAQLLRVSHHGYSQEYLRVYVGQSVIRMRTHKTISNLCTHDDERMYYTSYEGECAPGFAPTPDPDHAFGTEGVPYAPTYPVVAGFLANNPLENNPTLMRKIAKGENIRGHTELKTATVCAFGAETGRNLRSLPLSLMLLDLAEQQVVRRGLEGDAVPFTVDRAFWPRLEHTLLVGRERQTIGGDFPQSGAKGADTKILKMMRQDPFSLETWHYRTGFAALSARPSAPLGPLFQPTFQRGAFDTGFATLDRFAKSAVAKESEVVTTWLEERMAMTGHPHPLPNDSKTFVVVPFESFVRGITSDPVTRNELGWVTAIGIGAQIRDQARLRQIERLDQNLIAGGANPGIESFWREQRSKLSSQSHTKLGELTAILRVLEQLKSILEDRCSTLGNMLAPVAA